ncbi:unnamed protein product [Amoebophrya sp. A25]|nr:unnamed protein product [Amoebophrya sp. A25]|eukprot:GSA25T00021142001.1
MCWRCSANAHKPDVEKHIGITVARTLRMPGAFGPSLVGIPRRTRMQMLLEIDNFAHAQGVSAKLKAAFELTDNEVERSTIRNRIYFMFILVSFQILVIIGMLQIQVVEEEFDAHKRQT